MSGATTFVGRSARQQHHAPHPTLPPRPLASYSLPACLLGWLGCWARGRRLGGPSVSRHPLAGCFRNILWSRFVEQAAS